MPAEIKSINVAPVSTPARAVVEPVEAANPSSHRNGPPGRRRAKSQSAPMVLSIFFRRPRKTVSAFIDKRAIMKRKIFLGLLAFFAMVLILIFGLGDRLLALPFFNRPKPLSNQSEIIEIKEMQFK